MLLCNIQKQAIWQLGFILYTYTTMKKETNYNLFIGKTLDWTYVFLENAFKYDDWMKGLTGFELEFHTQEEADESLENLFDWEWFDFYIQYLQRTEDPNCTFYDRQDQVKSERDSDYERKGCFRLCKWKRMMGLRIHKLYLMMKNV